MCVMACFKKRKIKIKLDKEKQAKLDDNKKKKDNKNKIQKSIDDIFKVSYVVKKIRGS